MGCLLKLLSPVISVFVTLAVVGVVGYVLLNSALRPHDTVITVTSDTTKSCHGDPAQNDCTFLVRTNDGTFEDFEAKVLLRGTSGTVSRQLPKGHSYSVSVFGTSVPLFPDLHPFILHVNREISPARASSSSGAFWTVWSN